ncbi:MAG: hypothetical protein WD712_00505 [Candidatus Spechtbacterales bacterium]
MLNFPKIIFLAGAIALITTSFFVYKGFVSPKEEQEPVFCTQDAMLCPDGKTYVGRVAPDCEFAICPETENKTITADSIFGAAAQFHFSASVPSNWQTEAVTQIGALNFYDPATPADSDLEKSQIFMRYFEAGTFLTLTTVDILERTETQINARPAVRYVIKKKAGVPDFSNQPAWRNGEHVVTDIRVSDDDPSVFLVIAKNPALDSGIYARFLESIQFE